MKQHSKRNEDNTVTNISVTNKYNSTSSPSSEEEKEFKDEEFRKALIKLENEYQKKIVQGQKSYKMLGEGVVSYQALTRVMKEEADLSKFSVYISHFTPHHKTMCGGRHAA